MRLFPDTSILLEALRDEGSPASAILFSSNHTLFTNHYCLKECRRVLLKADYPLHQVENLIQLITCRCIILQTPQPHLFAKIKIRDNSDIPIVLGALRAGCILVIDDEIALRDAKKYVKAVRSEEVY
jgi:hypothetical protein